MCSIRTWGSWLAVAVLLIAGALPLGEGHAGKKQNCRSKCGAAIVTCIGQGYRKRFCKTELLALCRKGSTLCSAACSPETTGVRSAVDSAAELRQRLVGRWYDCKMPSSSVFSGPAGLGIEFTAGGQWYSLRLDGGTLVPDAGPEGEHGTFYIYEASEIQGASQPTLSMDIYPFHAGPVEWSLFEHPQQLVLGGSLLSYGPPAPACPKP